MFRIIVGVLAAFVGFSFGHSIPKWMEKKAKSTAETHSSSSSESAHPVRRLLLRRKSLCKFKFGSQKSGKENLEVDESLQQLSRALAEGNAPLKFSPNSLLCTSTRVHAEHKKLKLKSEKPSKEKMNNESSSKSLDSSPNSPLSAAVVDNESCLHQDACTNVRNGQCSFQDASANTGKERRSVQEMHTKSKTGHQDLHTEGGSEVELKIQEPFLCKTSSTRSMCGSPVKEKSQMKQWKMKLMSLRSKAMVSEKVWYEKFESGKSGGKPLVSSSSKGATKKHTKGKENEGPQSANTKRRDVSWSRSSSSTVSLLVEGPKSAFER